MPRASRHERQSKSAADRDDRWGAEAALSAYCRELCGPVAGEAAVAAILRTLENGPKTVTADELLSLTRRTAARFALAGSSGSRPNLGSAECAQTPARLAAGANGTLSPSRRHALNDHLDDCLYCKAIRIKQGRAERGFLTLWNPSPTPESRSARLGSVTRAMLENLETDLGSTRAEAAVRAYCRELCGATGSEPAVADSLYAAGIGSGSDPVPARDLLRMTRFAAADHASRALSEQRSECGDTPTHLADFANGGLGSGMQERHMDDCVNCSAFRIRMERAERAFAVVLAAPTAAVAAVPPVADAVSPEAPRAIPARPQARAAAPAPAEAPSTLPPVAKDRDALRRGDAPRRARRAPATPRTAPIVWPGTRRRTTAEPLPPTRVAPVAEVAEAAPPRRLPAASPRTRRRRGPIVLIGALIAAAAVAAVLVLSGQSGHSGRAPVASSTRAAGGTPTTHPPASPPAAAGRRSAKTPPAAHRAPANAHRAAKRRHAVAPRHRRPAAPVVVPVAATPVVVPAAPAPAPSPPPAAAPSSPEHKVSAPSATPQGTSLPAAPAPTQGIGSGH